jgi:hypothetical protein
LLRVGISLVTRVVGFGVAQGWLGVGSLLANADAVARAATLVQAIEITRTAGWKTGREQLQSHRYLPCSRARRSHPQL